MIYMAYGLYIFWYTLSVVKVRLPLRVANPPWFRRVNTPWRRHRKVDRPSKTTIPIGPRNLQLVGPNEKRTPKKPWILGVRWEGRSPEKFLMEKWGIRFVFENHRLVQDWSEDLSAHRSRVLRASYNPSYGNWVGPFFTLDLCADEDVFFIRRGHPGKVGVVLWDGKGKKCSWNHVGNF